MANLPDEVLRKLAEQDIATPILQSICRIVDEKELCNCPIDCANCLLAVDGDNITIEDQTPKDRATRLRKVLSLLYFNPEFDIDDLIIAKEQSNETVETE